MNSKKCWITSIVSGVVTALIVLAISGCSISKGASEEDINFELVGSDMFKNIRVYKDTKTGLQYIFTNTGICLRYDVYSNGNLGPYNDSNYETKRP